MAIHPDIQKKAQSEIDRITGKARLPDFQDRPSMPYMEAMYREVMRWMPPLHIGLPHFSTEDDVYKGYFIPKGVISLACLVVRSEIDHNMTQVPRSLEIFGRPFNFLCFPATPGTLFLKNF